MLEEWYMADLKVEKIKLEKDKNKSIKNRDYK